MSPAAGTGGLTRQERINVTTRQLGTYPRVQTEGTDVTTSTILPETPVKEFSL